MSNDEPTLKSVENERGVCATNVWKAQSMHEILQDFREVSYLCVI